MRRLRLPLTLSTLLHLAVAFAFAAGPMGLVPPDVELEDEAEEGPEEGGEGGELAIEELLNRPPFAVSIYAEPPPPAPPPATPEPTPEAALPLPAAPLPVAEVKPEPTPEPEPAPVPEPVPEVPPEPAPEVVAEPVLTDAEREALAAMEQGDATAAPEADDDGTAHEVAEERTHKRTAHWRHRDNKDRKKAKRPACPEPVETIARVAETHWYIDRDLIEYYATNLVELQKLGSVWTHRDANGKLDGFKVGLSRCSVLRQGGLKSGDVVHDINGRRINTVLQAVGAYLALRAEPELTVNVTRRGQPVTLSYTIEQPKRKAKRNARR